MNKISLFLSGFILAISLLALTPLFSQETTPAPAAESVATVTAKDMARCLATHFEKSLSAEIAQCFANKLAGEESLLGKSANKEFLNCLSEKTESCLAKKADALQSCATDTVTTCFPDKLKSNFLKKLTKITENCMTSKTETVVAENIQLCSTQVASTAAAPKTTIEGYPPDIKRILNRGEIIVAMLDADSPPFFFRKDGGEEIYGLDIELAHGIAEKLGVKLKFNRAAKTFNEVVDIIARGEADVAVSKLSRTLVRAQKVLFSEPYIIFHHGLLINRLRMAQISHGQNPKAFVQNLEGKIGVIAASSYVGYAKQKFPRAEIVEYKNWLDIITAVLDGDILAAYRDELEIKKAAYGSPEAALKVQTAVLTDTEDAIAMAVNWQDSHLLYWINEYIRSLNLQLNADKLLRKYPEVLKNQ